MFSPRSFIVLIATFRSMIQINFVCAVSLMSKFTVFHIRIQLLQRYLKFSFLGKLYMYLWQKSIYNLCESASAYSVLGHQSVFTSIPYSLGQYSFLVSQSCLCNEASIKTPKDRSLVLFGEFPYPRSRLLPHAPVPGSKHLCWNFTPCISSSGC